jgi:hypothetical protein
MKGCPCLNTGEGQQACGRSVCWQCSEPSLFHRWLVAAFGGIMRYMRLLVHMGEIKLR